MKDHRKQKKAAPIEEQSREEKGLKEDLPQGNGKDKTDDQSKAEKKTEVKQASKEKDVKPGKDEESKIAKLAKKSGHQKNEEKPKERKNLDAPKEENQACERGGLRGAQGGED